MKIFIFIFSLLFSTFSHAALYYQATYNSEIRYEREASQQMAARRPLNLGVGVRKAESSLIFEYSRFTEESGNTVTPIERVHQEYVLWLNYNLHQFYQWNLFAALGAGVYQDRVKTTLMDISTTDKGELQAMGGAGAGLKILLWEHLILSAEGRMYMGQNFDPDLQLGALLRIGAEF